MKPDGNYHLVPRTDISSKQSRYAVRIAFLRGSIVAICAGMLCTFVTGGLEPAGALPQPISTAHEVDGSANKQFRTFESLLTKLKTQNDRIEATLIAQSKQPREAQKQTWADPQSLVPLFSAFISGLFLLGIAVLVTHKFNKRQLQIQELQTVEKLIPHLMEGGEKRRTAILATAKLPGSRWLHDLTATFADEDTLTALRLLQRLETSGEAGRAVKEATASVLSIFGQRAFLRADFALSESCLAERAQLLLDLHGQKSKQYASNLRELGTTYRRSGKYAEAQVVVKQALDLAEKTFGKNSPELVEFLTDMAITCADQGDHKDARPYMERAFRLANKRFNTDVGIARHLQNLAAIYERVGDEGGATALYALALDIYDKHPGTNQLDAAYALSNLGLLKQKQHRPTEAEYCFRRALAIREALLPKEHPDLITILTNLADLLNQEHRLDEAAQICERAIRIIENRFGHAHLTMATAVSIQGNIARSRGDYPKSEERYKEALSITKQLVGETNPLVSSRLSNLVGIYLAQKRYAHALPLAEEALTIYDQNYGQNTRERINYLHNVIHALMGDRRYADARSKLAAALKLSRTLGKETSEYGTTLNLLAGFYLEQQKITKAEAPLKTALNLAIKVHGDKHPLTANRFANLAAFYAETNNLAEAETAMKQAIALHEDIYDSEHPTLIPLLENYSKLLRRLGKNDAAKAAADRAAAIKLKQNVID